MLAAALLLPASARSHVILTSHETRHGEAGIKWGPCGLPDSARGENVYQYSAGQRITLEWDEFVYHPGYFRISFDADGDDDFGDPADYFDLYSNPAVLLDDLHRHDRPGTRFYSTELALPDLECDRCTLQLVQVMTDKPPYEPGTNDLYYNCVDLVLLPEPGAERARLAALLGLVALAARRRPGGWRF